jgi:hypothetical protein
MTKLRLRDSKTLSPSVWFGLTGMSGSGPALGISSRLPGEAAGPGTHKECLCP